MKTFLANCTVTHPSPLRTALRAVARIVITFMHPTLLLKRIEFVKLLSRLFRSNAIEPLRLSTRVRTKVADIRSGIRANIYPSPGLKSRDKKDGWDRLGRAGKRRITAIRPVQRPRAARRVHTRATVRRI